MPSANQTKIAKSFATRINRSYRALEARGGDATKAVVKLANAARETGILLLAIKERIGHGGFAKWVKDNLIFSHDKSARLMSLARSHPETFSEYGDAVRHLQAATVASGHLSLPGREQPQTAKNYDFFSTLTKFLMSASETTNRQLEAEPLEEWPEARLEAVDEQLRPLAELRQRIEREIEARKT